MDVNGNNDLQPKDDAADETHTHEAVFVAATALTKGDRMGAKKVLGEAILADMDSWMVGALISDIKRSTGIPIGETRKLYDRMAGARKTEQGKAERVVPFAVYKPRAQPRPLADIADAAARLFGMRVSCSEDDITIVVLWCLGTYGVREGTLPGQEANAAPGPSRYPRLRVSSGAPNSGKSTLMETASYVAARAVLA